MEIRVPITADSNFRIFPAPNSIRVHLIPTVGIATIAILFIDFLVIYYSIVNFSAIILTIYLNLLVFLIYYMLVWTPYYYLKEDGKYAIRKFRESYKKGKLWKFIRAYRIKEDGIEYNVSVFTKGFSHYPVEVWIPTERHKFLMENIVVKIYRGYHPAKEGFLRKFDPVKELESVSSKKGDKWIIEFGNRTFELTEEEYEDLEYLLILYKRILFNLMKRGTVYDKEPAF